MFIENIKTIKAMTIEVKRDEKYLSALKFFDQDGSVIFQVSCEILKKVGNKSR